MTKGLGGLQTAAFGLLIAFICFFILAPLLVVLMASVSPTSYLSFPPQGFTLRWFTETGKLVRYWEAFKFSIQVAFFATTLSLVIATTVGITIARTEFAGKAALQSFFLSPIVIPELALALGLLQYFSQMGAFKGTVPLVLAHAAVCAPYAIRTIQAAAMKVDRNLEDCALSLGAKPARVLFDVTIPLVRPGIVAGAIMAFVMSFDNVTLSIFLSAPGSIPLPALLYIEAADTGLSSTLAAASAMLVVFMGCMMLLVEKFMGLEKVAATSLHGNK
jgi:putative spermidine/putrescine transport system permease protein